MQKKNQIGKKQKSHSYSNNSAIGVLLINLGTPDSPSVSAVRRYLSEFLWDRRIIELPRWLWWLILHGIILPFRPRRSAHAYQKIWTVQGSPMLNILKQQKVAIQQHLNQIEPDRFIVKYAMRYGAPSIKFVLKKLQKQQIRRLLVLPMYPQYSAATTASTFDALSHELTTWRWLPEVRFLTHYHDERDYIDALADSIIKHQKKHGIADKILCSFHGIPKKYFLSGDPYYCECHKTARLLSEKLGLNEQTFELTFQSRFGPKEWLQPYTDLTLKSLPKKGIKNVQVICPGFSADCLETLEEINIQGQEIFLKAGGEKFSYIPALNTQPTHITFISKLIIKQTQGW